MSEGEDGCPKMRDQILELIVVLTNTNAAYGAVNV